MQRILLATLAASLTIVSVNALPGRAGSGQDEDGGLTRVPPLPAAPEREAAPSFDPTGWVERLTDSDLDRREGAFAELAALAAADPAARAWLEELAADADRELAWTARLALREAAAPSRRGAGRPSPFGSFGASPWGPGGSGAGPGSGLDDLHRRMQEMQRELDALFGAAPLTPLGPGGSAPAPALPPGASRSQSGYSLEIGPDGARVTVTEIVDGEETRRTYEGESLEAILEQHPELREHFDLGGSGFRMGLDLGGSPFRSWFGAAPLPAPPQAVTRTDILGVVIRDLGEGERLARGLPAGAVLFVERVEPGTIASAIGLTPGDTLVELNGSPVGVREDIASALELRPATGEVTVVWIDSRGRRHERSWRPAEQQDRRR